MDYTYVQREALKPLNIFLFTNAITKLVPWMLENDLAGVHTLHGPDFGNGWVRSENDEIFLSKRTRLILRIPKINIDKINDNNTNKSNQNQKTIKLIL